MFVIAAFKHQTSDVKHSPPPPSTELKTRRRREEEEQYRKKRLVRMATLLSKYNNEVSLNFPYCHKFEEKKYR